MNNGEPRCQATGANSNAKIITTTTNQNLLRIPVPPLGCIVAGGTGAAEAMPPIRRMMAAGLKVSAGTDATRVASYNPWVSLAWLVTGKTVAGFRLYPPHNCLDRETALRMWTENVTWFSNEEGKKGRIQAGQFADLMVPDRDYFACAEDEIAGTTSLLTIVGGKIAYDSGDFAALEEVKVPPAMPDWSPVRTFGGYGAWADPNAAARPTLANKFAMSCGCANACAVHGHNHALAWSSRLPIADLKSFLGRARLRLLGGMRFRVRTNTNRGWALNTRAHRRSMINS
jgi:Amidohydrolase family